MPRLRIPQAQPIDEQRRESDKPTDYGHRTRRCSICDAWLSRYNPDAICNAHKPSATGILLETEPGRWRWHLYADGRLQGGSALHELMSEAP